MFLSTQYYRPPFPEGKHWKDDFARMRDAGLDAAQLWAVWGWIEPEEGVFRFEDYDELVSRAGDVGLKIIITVMPELQPFWIHRAEPDAYMVDHLGNKAISGPRIECNSGITPGVCFDHPSVLDRMANFLRAVGTRYGQAPNLLGWDAWSENRWALHSDGYVCFCSETLSSFRKWLAAEYGDLDGLNLAWKRRYTDWEDVRPGKVPGRTYTEQLEFMRFLSWRSSEHTRFRAEILREADGHHIISSHCGINSTAFTPLVDEQCMMRGNDWDHAEHLDSYGLSIFSFWEEGFSEDSLSFRVESVRSAAGDKTLWLSEYQGGAISNNFEAHVSVEASKQQCTLWNIFSRGAKGANFWCWRDEVFGPETCGYGFIGGDGCSEDRVRHLARTAAIIRENNEVLDAYRPDPAEVGVWFDPMNYCLDWAQNGMQSWYATSSVEACGMALERLGIPYDVVEAAHSSALSRLKILFMPWSLIVRAEAKQELLKFVKRGGTLVCEAETDSFTRQGFFRYPEERDFATSLGLLSEGWRVPCGNLSCNVADEKLELICRALITPLIAANGEVLASGPQGAPLVVRNRVGDGQVIAVGAFPGLEYAKSFYPDYECFVGGLVRCAGVVPKVNITSSSGQNPHWRTGLAGSTRLLFISNCREAGHVRVELPVDYIGDSGITDITRDEVVKFTVEGGLALFEMSLDQYDYLVLAM